MAPGPGRPARPAHIEPRLLHATEQALLQLGAELGLPTGRYPDPHTGRPRTRPRPLDLAVTAIKAQEALEVLARRQVALARQHDQLTWAQSAKRSAPPCSQPTTASPNRKPARAARTCPAEP
jgi:hypothetical protein